MPRRLQQTFHCSPLEELTHQLLFAPPAKRIEQVHRAERLHDEIETDCPYPLDYLVYRITGYRRDDDGESPLLVGEAVRPDLRLMIDHLSHSVTLTTDTVPNPEPVETVEQVARRLNVSVKTVNRWRKAGLRWRWTLLDGTSRKQIIIPRSALAHFTDCQTDRVQRASRFTTIPDAERDALIERARTIVKRRKQPMTLNQVAAQLADECGRALETMRLLLEKHDRAHPQRAIFTDARGPLTPREKRVIERAYRIGIAPRKLAERFGRTRHTIHRIIRERRAAAARHIDLRHVHSPTFNRDDADQVILRAVSHVESSAEPGKPAQQSNVPVDDLPEPLRALYRQPGLSDERQRSLFVRYNYLKYKAQRVRDAFDRHEPRAASLDQFESLVSEARRVRSELVRANLPVVLSVARRHLIGKQIGESDGMDQHLVTMLDQGQAALLEAVETYNASWSHTFASYLTNRLLKQFAHLQSEASARRQARRRLTGEQLYARLIAQARERDVELA